MWFLKQCSNQIRLQLITVTINAPLTSLNITTDFKKSFNDSEGNLRISFEIW